MRAFVKLLIFVAVVVTSSWISAPAARAQWATRGGGPCREDMEKFCKDAPQGRGQVHQCMQQHLADLSPECREHMQGMQRAGVGRGALRSACSSDTEKFCKELKPGQGGLYRCLRAHESELSEACKNAITGAPRAGAH